MGDGDASTSIKTRLRSAKFRVAVADGRRSPIPDSDHDERYEESTVRTAPPTPVQWSNTEGVRAQNCITPTGKTQELERLEAQEVEELMRQSYLEAMADRDRRPREETASDAQATSRVQRICPGCISPTQLHIPDKPDYESTKLLATHTASNGPSEAFDRTTVASEPENPIMGEDEEEEMHLNTDWERNGNSKRGPLDNEWKEGISATIATLCSSMRQEFSGMMEAEKKRLRQESTEEAEEDTTAHTRITRARAKKRMMMRQGPRSPSVETVRQELQEVKWQLRKSQLEREQEKEEIESKLTQRHRGAMRSLEGQVEDLKEQLKYAITRKNALPEVPREEPHQPKPARQGAERTEQTRSEAASTGAARQAQTEPDTIRDLRSEIAQLQELLRAPSPGTQLDGSGNTAIRMEGVVPLPPNIKLPRFNGDNWYAFEDLFETIARLQKWKGTEKLTWFLSCIDEKARMYLEVDQDELLTYEQARRSMEERYGNRMSTFDIKRRIRSMKRNAGESMESFADRLQAIAQRGRIEKDEKMDLFYRAFIDAVSEEPKLQMYIEQQKKLQRRARLPDLLRMVREYRERSPLRTIQEREVNVCQSVDKRKGPLKHEDDRIDGEVEKEGRRVWEERAEKRDRGDRILRSDVDYNTGEIEFVKKVIRASGLMEGIKEKLEKMKHEKSFLEPLGDGTPEPDWRKIRQRQREFREKRNARRAKGPFRGNGGYDRSQDRNRGRRSVSTHTALDDHDPDQDEFYWSDDYADDE